jgi:hypothetical protein
MSLVKNITITCTALLFVVTGNVWSETIAAPAEIVQGPFETNIFPGGKIWVEKINESHKSLALVLESTNSDGVIERRRVDAYDDSGTGPTVESIFFYPVKGKKSIVVLVSWGVNSHGIATYGKLYQVYAYEREGQDKIVPNAAIILDRGLSGMDGYQDGSVVVFKYKDATSIKRYIAAVVDNKR